MDIPSETPSLSQQPISSNPFTDKPIHVVLVSLLPVLVSLVAVKYQGKTLTAFETHPVTSTISVISLLVYYCLAFALKRELVSTEACSPFMTFSGSLSLVTLASLLLPQPLGVALYAFYSLALVAESYSSGTVPKLYDWICQIVNKKPGNGPVPGGDEGTDQAHSGADVSHDSC